MDCLLLSSQSEWKDASTEDCKVEISNEKDREIEDHDTDIKLLNGFKQAVRKEQCRRRWKRKN